MMMRLIVLYRLLDLVCSFYETKWGFSGGLEILVITVWCICLEKVTFK
jgi:hypothetical protein